MDEKTDFPKLEDFRLSAKEERKKLYPKGGGPQRRTAKTRAAGSRNIASPKAARNKRLAKITGRPGLMGVTGKRDKKTMESLVFAGVEAIRLLAPEAAKKLCETVEKAVRDGEMGDYDLVQARKLVDLELNRQMFAADVYERGPVVKDYIQGSDGKVFETTKSNDSAVLMAKMSLTMCVVDKEMGLSKRSRGESALNESAKREFDERAELMRSARHRMPAPMNQIGSAITVEIVKS